MEEIATYYVTLKPIREGAAPAVGMRNIAYVNDPALDEVGIYLSEQDNRIVPSEEIQKNILDYLRNCGIVKPENWVEVSEEEYLSERNLELGVEDSESYNDLSKRDGSGQWLVRYEYSGPSDDKNRDFCAEILSIGRIYTEEEIKNGLSNPEFGNYSIWDYKGSYGCRHRWRRIIYFEDYKDDEVRKVGFVPQVVARLDDGNATTLNAYLSKDEKMQVLAPLLIPDKKIFRNDEIGRYNMVFSKDTIAEMYNVALSKEVFEKGDLFKDTHKGSTAPSYVLDHWIAEDENDKAYTEYGLDPKRMKPGTLFVLSQVTDKEYWEKEIKANKKYAYSIEALMNLTIIKMSSQKEIKYSDVIVLNDKDEFLLLQRSEGDDYEPNKLCFPGGKIEAGESEETAAVRELLEETGINESNVSFVDSIVNSDGTVSNYFTVKTGQNFKPSDEHKSFSWVKSIDSLPSEMFIEGDKERLVSILNKVYQMDKDQILLPDGEHLINGTIYVVKDGVVIEKKEVTSEQEAVIEEVAEATPEVMEEVKEDKPVEEMEEVIPAAPVETVEPETEGGNVEERLTKLEKSFEELLLEFAKWKGEMAAPKTEDLPIEMSDKRPLWMKISDGINAIKKQQ